MSLDRAPFGGEIGSSTSDKFRERVAKIEKIFLAKNAGLIAGLNWLNLFACWLDSQASKAGLTLLSATESRASDVPMTQTGAMNLCQPVGGIKKRPGQLLVGEQWLTPSSGTIPGSKPIQEFELGPLPGHECDVAVSTGFHHPGFDIGMMNDSPTASCIEKHPTPVWVGRMVSCRFMLFEHLELDATIQASMEGRIDRSRFPGSERLHIPIMAENSGRPVNDECRRSELRKLLAQRRARDERFGFRGR